VLEEAFRKQNDLETLLVVVILIELSIIKHSFLN